MSDNLKDFFRQQFANAKLDVTNQQFITALEVALYSDKSLYITGKAGTGKTTFLKTFTALSQKNMAVVAPTGVAAINAGGKTIHSFFKIDPREVFLPGDSRLSTRVMNGQPSIFDTFQYNKDQLEVIRHLKTLIIDEVSMVRADMLDLIDVLLRTFRKRAAPFGGVQLILIGDPFQLPPVVRSAEWEILSQHYSNRYFFASKAFENLAPFHIALTKIYRQKDEAFKALLNRVRLREHTYDDVALLNDSSKLYHFSLLDEGYIMLGTHNASIVAINDQKLAALEGSIREFPAVLEGNYPNNLLPFEPANLKLKVGAQVIFMKNNASEGYYNGLMGKVEAFNNDSISVRAENNVSYQVKPEIWENIQYVYDEARHGIVSEVLGTCKQFPLKLAWAITVHKSQGLTFSKAVLDIGKSFEYGQAYVALSRCTSLDYLVLKDPIHSNCIKVSADSISFSKQQTTQEIIEQALAMDRANAAIIPAFQAFKKGDYDAARALYDAIQQEINIKDTPKWQQFLRVKEWLEDRHYVRKF